MEWLPDNWDPVWTLETPVLELMARGAVIYLGIMALLRIMPRRTGGELTTTDLIVILLLAESATHAFAIYTSAADALLLMATLLALERAQLQVVEGVNLISKLELEKAQLDVDKARLELELAQKALRTFEQKRAAALKVEDIKVEAAQRKVTNKQEGLELVELRAPVDGVLYAPYTRINWQRTKVMPGVVARGGDKVLEIPDLSRYHAHLHLRQRDAALISEGDAATISPLILPDQPISGKVIKKDAFATTRNERLGTETSAGNLKEVLITVELDEAPPQLRPGNSARVVLRSTLAEDATLLPIGAAKRRDDNTWAVRMSDGSERPVTLGRTNLSHVEVLDGLKPGERVMLSAADAPAQ